MLIHKQHRQEGRHYRISWSIGTRIENANLLQTKGGNFEGAYFRSESAKTSSSHGRKVLVSAWTVLCPCLPAAISFDRSALQLDTARPFHPKEISMRAVRSASRLCSA